MSFFALLMAMNLTLAGAVKDRVVVHTDVTHQALVDRVTLALEEALPIMEQELGVKLPSNQSIVLHLFESIDTFRERMRELQLTGFDHSGAVTAWREEESFVVVQPRSEPEYLSAVDDLPEMTLQLVLHEAVHQVLAKAGHFPPKYTPAWFNEGIAEYLTWRLLMDGAPQSAGVLTLRSKQRRLRQAVDVDAFIPLESLFAEGFDGEEASAMGRDMVYTQSLSLVRFLMDRKSARWGKAFQKLRRDLARRGTPHSAVLRHEEIETIDKMWRRHLGKDRIEDLTGDWVKWIRAEQDHAKTPWIEQWRSSQWQGEELVSAAVAWGNNSLALRAQPSAGATTIACQLNILPIGETQADIVLYRAVDTADTLKVTVRRDGHFKILALKGEWITLAAAAIPKLDKDAWWQIEAELTADSVRATLNGSIELKTDLPDGLLESPGRSGLGTFQSAVRYRNIVINGEPIEPANS